jgi:hypothetical protein
MVESEVRKVVLRLPSSIAGFKELFVAFVFVLALFKCEGESCNSLVYVIKWIEK